MVNEFSFSTPELRNALMAEGVEYLARLFPGFRSEDRFSTNLIGEPILLDDLSEFYLVSLRGGSEPAAELRLRAIRGVSYADWPRLGKALSAYTPDDQYFPKQWGLSNTEQQLCTGYNAPPLDSVADINAPEAWGIEKGLDSSVRVGIIDSGILATHEDFGGRVNSDSGASFVPVMPPPDPYPASVPCDDFSPDCDYGPVTPDDDNGHGTGVAGIVAATGDNDIGVAGVAWGVTLIPIKVIDCNTILSSCNSARALDWARTKFIPILNMSYNTGGPDASERAAVRNAFYAGQLLVGGAGNDNDSLVIYPAKHAKMVCAVGAFFANGRRWNDSLITGQQYKGSCWGPEVDLAAPGGSKIATTSNGARQSNNTYNSLSTCSNAFGGTSAAAPVVSGVAALLLSAYPTLVGEDLYQGMIRTARHPDPESEDT